MRSRLTNAIENKISEVTCGKFETPRYRADIEIRGEIILI
jgi:hypothetical protein